MSVCVIGAGGHAKVVVATLQAAGEEVAGIYDDDASKHGSELLGVRVLGSIEAAARGVHHAIIAGR